MVNNWANHTFGILSVGLTGISSKGDGWTHFVDKICFSVQATATSFSHSLFAPFSVSLSHFCPNGDHVTPMTPGVKLYHVFILSVRLVTIFFYLYPLCFPSFIVCNSRIPVTNPWFLTVGIIFWVRFSWQRYRIRSFCEFSRVSWHPHNPKKWVSGYRFPRPL